MIAARRGLRLAVLAAAGALACLAQDALPSWNNSAAKQAILNFVARTTRPGSPEFVPPEERIATFDNDGTLWVEQPIYTQFAFAIDRLKAAAPQHPEWIHEQPFRAALSGDLDAFAASGEKGVLGVMMATHAGMTTDAFEKTVKQWIASARHPRFQRLYTECVYQPMLEVLAYFRKNGFKTYIVSGGGVEFMRPWTEATYGIVPEQVIGSTIRTRFDYRGGQPVLKRLPEVNFVDDKGGKPVAIDQVIGRRPVAAFGNSDGDQQMLEWTAAGKGARLMLLVHHTDAQREYAYDRKSAVGRLDSALDEARLRGWIVVDMKRDWKTVFPPARDGL
jgi:haloacid dehalogenase-like hydrolase